MKNKDFKSVTNILDDQNDNKHFYGHMDFEDTQNRIDQDIIPKEIILDLPKKYFNNLIKFIKGEK